VYLSSANSRNQTDTIDDLGIYNRALSPTEVQKLYHLGTVTVRPSQLLCTPGSGPTARSTRNPRLRMAEDRGASRQVVSLWP